MYDERPEKLPMDCSKIVFFPASSDFQEEFI
jgi:hypothetical protein